MLAYFSLLLAVAAAAITLGGVELSMGHWPGISLGLAAALAGGFELRSSREASSRPRRPAQRIVAWIGTVLGLGAALLGIAVYLGWGIAAGRVG